MTPQITISVQVDECTTLVIEREYLGETEIIRDHSGDEVRRIGQRPSADQVTKLASAVAAALSYGELQSTDRTS